MNVERGEVLAGGHGLAYAVQRGLEYVEKEKINQL